MSIIVAGGFTGNAVGLTSVEILDEDARSWRPGPPLPVVKWSGALVEDQRGGVVFAGGYQASGIGSSTIYCLRHGGLSAQWELMAQKLRQPNYLFTGLIIPDNLVNCTYT